MSQIEITARDLRALLVPVIPHAGDVRGFPQLHAIRLSVQGEHLLATATDRYSLAICRHKVDGPAEPFEAVVPLPAVKQILSVFRVTKAANPRLRISVEDGVLTVTAIDGLVDFAGATLKYQLILQEFPKVEPVIVEALAASPEPIDAAGFNAEYLARFRAATSRNEPLVCRQSTPSKPMLVTAGDHFIAAIMPVRLDERKGSEYSAAAAASWEALLKPPPARKKAAPRKRAAKKAVA